MKNKYDDWKDAMEATNKDNVIEQWKGAWKISSWWGRSGFIQGIAFIIMGIIMMGMAIAVLFI